MVAKGNGPYDKLQEELDRVGQTVSKRAGNLVKVQIGYSIMVVEGTNREPYEHEAKVSQVVGTAFLVSETGFLVQLSGADFFTVRIESLENTTVEDLINALQTMS